MIQPNLDRFSWRGPNERRGVKSLLETDSCDVCGHDVSSAYLVSWNGEDVCKYCVRELEEEYEQLSEADQL